MRYLLCLCLYCAMSMAFALNANDMDNLRDQGRISWRGLSASDPHGLIERARAALDKGTFASDPANERELLWWMGHAAINASDDAALLEVALRLDSLGNLRSDVVALAYADFLRADEKIQRGDLGGMNPALQAAARLQDNPDAALRALAQFQLCDAYAMSGNDARALPLCRTAAAAFRALGDEWDIAQAENNIAICLFNQGKREEAVETYLRAQARYVRAGDTTQAIMVGDNLARVYLDMGRAKEALQLSRTSYTNERAAGRITDALLSSANIARAYASLGDLRTARKEIDQTVTEARDSHNNGVLPDLLQAQSRIAESSGDLKAALQIERELEKIQAAQNSSNVQAEQNELEVRYAARENELRIRDLERDNRLKDLEIKTVQGAAQQREELAREQTRLLWSIGIASLGLVLAVVLLTLLLRTQRQHAAQLHMQTLRDPLTGVENRRGFFAHMRALLAAPPAAPHLPHALMLIDLDNFKRVNDSFGHPFGDEVLARVAECMQTALGAQGNLARLGGEEFAVLCPHIGSARGLQVAETLRAAVAKLHFAERQQGMQVTISVGIALFDGVRNRDADSWLRSADAALYAGKGQGRDRVIPCAFSMPAIPLENGRLSVVGKGSSHA